MATLKLKKPAGSPSTGKPPAKPERAPLRGAGSGVKKRPTLAQAQAERAEHEARYQEQRRLRWGDQAPAEPARRGGSDRPRPRPDANAPDAPRPRGPRRDAPQGEAPRGRPRRDEMPRGDALRGAPPIAPRDAPRDARHDSRRDAPRDARRQAPHESQRTGRHDAPPRRDAPPRHGTAPNTAFGGGNTAFNSKPARNAPRPEPAGAAPGRRAPNTAFGGQGSERGNTRPAPNQAFTDRRPPTAQPGSPARAAPPARPKSEGRHDSRAATRPEGRPARSAPPAPEQRSARPRPAPKPRQARHDDRDLDVDHDHESFHAEVPGSMRLSKRMSELGIASRREADEWIPKGWVRVDGQVVTELGSRVLPGQHITLDARARDAQAMKVTILLNKPVGYVSGQAEDGYEPASVLVTAKNQWREDSSGIRFLPNHLRGLAPAGRLDIDSVGLLVLTQDGRIAKQLIGEDSEIDKEYLVRVQSVDDQPLPPDKLALLNHGLELDGEPLRPAQVEWVNDDQLRFVLREGKKRQIRRMCEAVGLKVVGLKRVRIGQVVLGDLPPGQWRYLRGYEQFGPGGR